MSRPAISLPPEPRNEPVKDYAPGSPERAELQQRLRELERDRIEIPLVIGGKDVKTDGTFEAVMPHRKSHILADVHAGGPAQVDEAIAAAREARHDWGRMPWEDRAAIFLRAAELLAGPWRATLNAATMLGQSKTAHQAEIDAACELIDFWRFNPTYMRRIRPTTSCACSKRRACPRA
jgi:1-pyrroline-5-carboxylate dehydrogenase